MNPDDLTAAPTEPRTMPDAGPTTQAGAPAQAAPEALPAQGHAITLRKLNAFYGTTHAVKDVDLDYAANRVTAMIGPSGCGKSTLVRCINRMHEEIRGAHAEGTVTLDGHEVDAGPVDVDVVHLHGALGTRARDLLVHPVQAAQDRLVQRAWGTALTLVVMILLLNLAARLIARRSRLT